MYRKEPTAWLLRWMKFEESEHNQCTSSWPTAVTNEDI